MPFPCTFEGLHFWAQRKTGHWPDQEKKDVHDPKSWKDAYDGIEVVYLNGQIHLDGMICGEERSQVLDYKFILERQEDDADGVLADVTFEARIVAIELNPKDSPTKEGVVESHKPIWTAITFSTNGTFMVPPGIKKGEFRIFVDHNGQSGPLPSEMFDLERPFDPEEVSLPLGADEFDEDDGVEEDDFNEDDELDEENELDEEDDDEDELEEEGFDEDEPGDHEV